MFEALGEWMGYPLYYTHFGGTPPKRTGASHATIYPYGPFDAGDGKSVVLGLQNEREWALLRAGAGAPANWPTIPGSAPTRAGWPTVPSSRRSSTGCSAA